MTRLYLEFASYLVFLPLLIGLLHYRNLNANLKTVLAFIIFGALTEVFADIYQMVYEQNTMPIGNVYFPLSILILSLFYTKVLDGYVSRKIIVGLVICYELFCVINLLFFQNLYEFPNIPGALGALIMLFFAILLFSKIIVDADIEKIYNEPIVWINIAVLIYYSAGLFYYILFNYSLQFSREFVYTTVKINATGSIFLFVLITIAFAKAGRKVPSGQ